MTEFQPITTQADLDDIVRRRLDRQSRVLSGDADSEGWKAESRKWEQRAKANLARARRAETDLAQARSDLDDDAAFLDQIRTIVRTEITTALEALNHE